MKLLKIVSKVNQDTGYFTSSFNEQIDVTPNSQVALINMSYASDALNIVVDNTNNTFQFRIKNTATLNDVTLTNGAYIQSNFLDMLTRQMNLATPLVNDTTANKDTGFEWLVGRDNNDTIQIQYGRSGLDSFEEPVESNMSVDADDISKFIANQNAVATGITGGIDFNYVFDETEFVRGSGVLQGQCVIQTGVNPPSNFGATGFIALVSDVDTVRGQGSINSKQFAYGMYVKETKIFKVVSGVAKEIGTQLKEDLMEIRLNKGKVEFHYGDTHYDEDVPYEEGKYFPFAGIQLKDQIIDTVAFTPSPIGTDALDMDLPLTLKALQTYIVEIVMPDSVRNLLGFDTGVEFREKAQSYTWYGDASLLDTNTPTSISVEMLLGRFNSYDSVSEDRRQIVAVVPNSSEEGNIRVYEPPFPMFVDVNNAISIPISLLTLRVLNTFTNEPVNLAKPIAMTIAIKP